MRIALIADTHGALDERVAERLRGADLIVHAGDVGANVQARLQSLADTLAVVQGNNDPPDSWATSRCLTLPGGDLAVIHGHQWSARTRHRKLRAAFPDARAIVCGHSHRRVIDMDAVPWVLNPGACGRSRAYGGPGYIELLADDSDWIVEPVVFEPSQKPLRR